MVLVGNEDVDESLDAGEQENRTRAIVSAETASILAGLGNGPLDVRIKRLAEERDDLQVDRYRYIYLSYTLATRPNF